MVKGGEMLGGGLLIGKNLSGAIPLIGTMSPEIKNLS
jgi:hypothetical protein